MKKSITKPERNKIRVVGIGASAGGLEALEQFFKNVPKNTGMAFVVILHLDPNSEGLMPEILQRTTSMAVSQITDRLKVKRNCVYVIPPNKSLRIINGALHLSNPVESHGLRLPVDIFFQSLAYEKGAASIGIILSGMGADGSLGLQAIKEKNGITLVQDPVTAKFDSMPRSAIAAVNIDIIASADDLPAMMTAFLESIPEVKPDIETDLKIKNGLDKIIGLLHEQSGNDFSLYKKNTLIRRIERRKGIHQIDKIQNYVDFLLENPKEIEILYKELLIGVTNFFRDNELWEKLKETILPDLLKGLPDGYVLRTWVPGCSTGEEAYSLAIVFIETLEKLKNHKDITLQIFASDLDVDSIEKARKGYFQKNIITQVTPERLARFFTIDQDGYRINSVIREMVVFAPQNVIKDPPFTKLDMLSCRNMLIYLEPELQKKIIELFKYSLNIGGILILGTSETPGTFKEGLDEMDAKMKIFRRTASVVATELIDIPSSFYRYNAVAIKQKRPLKGVENIQTLVDQILLQRFAPASVLVTEKGDILYITGRTGKYLEPVAGKANWNIHAMARIELRQILPRAFRKALRSFEMVIIRNVKLKTNSEIQLVDVTVQRIEYPDPIKGMIMVLFTDVPVNTLGSIKKLKQKGKNSSGRIKEVETELEQVYEDLQGTQEEMRLSQEELNTANQELQSINEELQSTNEELTTSKEEMQSLNEELQTVNIQLQNKVNDYLLANSDMKNLLNSTEIATLFLDKEMNIRRFTPQVTKLFKLRDSDIGRPITELVSDLKYPEIGSQAQYVLHTLKIIETAIETKNGRWLIVRILPYRTLDDQIDGLVITFTDITVAKSLESELKKVTEVLIENKKQSVALTVSK